jgi:hypothetical protein
MAAHAAHAPGAALQARRTRIRRPHPRFGLVLVVATMVLLLVAGPGAIARAAHAACTAGEPARTTCGEALVRLGYP